MIALGAAFVLGAILGACAGLVVAALAVAARTDDWLMELHHREVANARLRLILGDDEGMTR